MAQIIAYTVIIHGRLDTRVETRCPGGFSISCFASRYRHFSYSEIEFYFQVLVKFSLYHAKKSLPVYLYINLLFQIITLLALDKLSEFEVVTIVITGYMLRYYRKGNSDFLFKLFYYYNLDFYNFIDFKMAIY